MGAPRPGVYPPVVSLSHEHKHRRIGRWGRRPEVGARPGELVPPVEDSPVEVHAFDYSSEQCREWRPRLSEIGPTPPECRIRWLDVHGLSDLGVLERIADVFEVHPLALADIVNVGQRAKVDAYEHNHLIVLRMIRLCPRSEALARRVQGGANGLVIEYEQVSMVVGDNFVLTLQEAGGDVFDPIRNRLRERLGNVRHMGPDYLAYVLLDAVVDAYFPVADHIGAQFEALERQMVEDGDQIDLNRIHMLRSELRDFDRPVRQMQALLSTLLNSDQSPISEGVRVWLRDVYDHVLQIRELIDRHREFAIALMELHLSTANNKMNEVMKLLTVISSIFIPLTFIASIYGMNFEFMPELHQPWGYPLVLLVMVTVASVLILFFRRRNWL